MSTVEVAAARLGVSASDASLPALLTAASSALARFTGYPLHRQTGVEESAVGQGGVYLFLRAGAVQSVQAITVSGTTLAATCYALDGKSGQAMGRLVARAGYRWPFTGQATGGVSSTPYRAHDTGELVVTFTSGWVTPGQVELAAAESPPRKLTSDMPAELEQAVLEVVTAWRSAVGRDGRVTAMSTGDASVNWDTAQAALPSIAQVLVGPYCKPTRRTL